MIRLFANGTDITSLISDRLLGCTLSDRRSGEVDELSIELDNHDGQLALPDPGAALQVWFPEGDSFVAMGKYQVDSVETGGSPITVSIRATSADITDSLKTQREQSWNDTTLGAVLTEVARRNNLTPLIESTLSNRVIDHLDQTTESDLSLINRLGDDHDAVATVKSGTLVFMPTGQGTTPAGTELPTVPINLTDCTSWRYTKTKTTYSGVTCHFNNRAYARRDSVTVGSADNLFVIRATQRTAQAARELADAKWKKLKRAEQALELDLELLVLDVIAEASLRLVGFPADVPGTGWVVSEAEHTISGDGFRSRVSAELIL
jgi:uncharacterized protein